MFADPQSLTISEVSHDLPRISVGDMTSRYRNGDGSLTLSIAHKGNSRESSVVKLTFNKVGTDPFNSNQNRTYSGSVHLVLNTPANGLGFTDAELTEYVQALLGFLTEANIAKFLGKES